MGKHPSLNMMGERRRDIDKESATWGELKMENMRGMKVVGRGAMGTVFLVHDTLADPQGRRPFALKLLHKSSLQTKPDAERRASWEIQVLSRLNQYHHPFLPPLLGSFEDHRFVAWATPYCPGGDLNHLRQCQSDGAFAPSVIRFYLAEILCALHHLHSLGIVYRDLKPENVLIQHSGHLTLTDFDLSRPLSPNTTLPIQSHCTSTHHHHRRHWVSLFNNNGSEGLKKMKPARVIPVSRRKVSFVSNGERSNSFVGTDEYVSPEVVRGDGHEFAVDWWALGILGYEMLYGVTPFKGRNRKETFRNILMKAPVFPGKRTALTDLIERLLHKDPTRRLGYVRGASEIKEHDFFRGVQWDLLAEVVRPPFIPSKEDDMDAHYHRSGGVDIGEYFDRLRSPPSPDIGPDTSFTEF